MGGKGVAVVTGAAQGIGRGIALRLAADGFDVAFVDLPSSKAALEAAAKEARAHGHKTAVLTADVTSESDVKGLVASTVSELGGVDVVSWR